MPVVHRDTGQRHHTATGAELRDSSGCSLQKTGNADAVLELKLINADLKISDIVASRSSAEKENVGTRAAGQDVIPPSPDQCVVAIAAIEHVVPILSIERIIAGTAEEAVIAVAAK